MFSFTNRTVFDIPSTWDRSRFEAANSKYRQARKLIQISINVQFERQLKTIHLKNLDLEKQITETNEHRSKHEKNVNIFNNLTEIASESLATHFDKRMKNIRTMIEKHCHAIQTIFQDENQYWKDIHSAIDQNLITSNNDSSDENLIGMKSQHHSAVLPSINKTSLTKFKDITNRLSSIHSEPNPPAQLYFSPTILRDEQSENIRNELSPFNQNQNETNLMKPRVIIRRIDPALLLDYLTRQENTPHNSFALSETGPKCISRKRKKSISEDKDIKHRNIVLRRRKSVSVIEIDRKKPKKQRNRTINKKQIPIRELSPLPMIDRSKHYHTRFSPRSHRSNHLIFPTTNTKNKNECVTQTKSPRLRKKRPKKS